MSNYTSRSNPATANLPDTWDNRIQQAAACMSISVKDVERLLQDYGVSKDHPDCLAMLSDEVVTPFGDLRRTFCEDDPLVKVKVPVLRMAMKCLRGPTAVDTKTVTESVDPEMATLKEKFGIKVRLEDIEPTELLPYYRPEKVSHPITSALRKRFGDKKVIVFKEDSKEIDVEATANYMSDLEQGFPEQDTVEGTDGSLSRLYPIGQVPNQMIEEDPLFPGQPLKRGRSIVNRLNWSAIKKEDRQLCRIIVERNDIDPNDRLAVKNLMSVINDKQNLVVDFAEACLDFKERKAKDELPKLTMTLQEASGKYNNNPFQVGGNRRY